MSPPNTQHRRAYAAILAFHTSRATALSGHREENDTTATNTSPSTTSRSNEERIRSNARSVLNVQSVTTPLRPVTATTSYSRTSSSSASNYTSTVSMRSDGSHHPVLRNLVAIASRGRAALQNSSSNPNNLHHLTSSSSSSTSSHRSSTAHNGPPAIHPQFRSKAVCKLTCSACTAVVCSRGMKAILLADTRVELYSTDTPPIGVQLVNDDYMTRNCRCRIRDVACLGCGSVVGYHVTTPCNTCLDACNNGHFWMFHAEGIHSSDRMDETGTKTLLWATIPCAERDVEGLGKLREFLCR